ncbi:hypothetical protein [Azospirillum thiophilum]|uniref:hypothetical protein n=1 Tax=Azospirillum thiophilum TaxID=528244 RepID=UPI00118766DE|nr:hypothetical protein [Azospirillum thiophilum]
MADRTFTTFGKKPRSINITLGELSDAFLQYIKHETGIDYDKIILDSDSSGGWRETIIEVSAYRAGYIVTAFINGKAAKSTQARMGCGPFQIRCKIHVNLFGNGNPEFYVSAIVNDNRSISFESDQINLLIDLISIKDSKEIK